MDELTLQSVALMVKELSQSHGEIIKRIDTLERKEIKRDEQFLNFEKSIFEISKSQQENKVITQSLEKEIKEQQNSLINKLIEKQDSLIQLFVGRDKEESKTMLKEKEIDSKIEIQQNQLEVDKYKKFWDSFTKIALAIISVVTIYLQLVKK